MVAAASPLRELTDAARSAPAFRLQSTFDLPDGAVVSVEVDGSRTARGWSGRLGIWEARGCRTDAKGSPVKDPAEAVQFVIAKYPTAVLRPGSVKVTVPTGPGDRFLPVALGAWSEALRLYVPPPPDPTPRRIVRMFARPTDFAGFLGKLKDRTDPKKLDKALTMLQAGRFRLFAKVEEDHLIGVVKSQTEEGLVYSCRLAADGGYGCCTQNLNVCGGLRGSPCKHLLVLLVGLVKADELDPGTAYEWTEETRGRDAVLDKDAMTQTFLRYKGAEAGEIDWRPTETIPEDFYAM